MSSGLMTLDQGAGGLFSQFADVGGGAFDDIYFWPDDTYYIGYDPSIPICGRPRQINVTRQIDLGGTSNSYDPLLNFLASGSCTVPIINAKIEGHFYSNVTGVPIPLEIWGGGPWIATTGHGVFIHSNKSMSGTLREGSVILAGYEAAADAESEKDKIVEVGIEPGDGVDIMTFQYFAGNKQLIARGLRAAAMTDLVGYGAVPSASYQADSERAGLEVFDDASNDPSTLTLWGRRDDHDYDGTGQDGVNAEIMADVNKLTLDLDMVELLLRWRNNTDVDTDLYRFKRDQMEIVDGDIGYLLGTDVDGADAVGARVGSDESFSVAGSRLVEWVNNTAVRGYLAHDGSLGILAGDNGEQVSVEKAEHDQTIAAAANTICAVSIPAGALCIGVSTYVIATLPGATVTYGVGVAGFPARYAAAVASLAGVGDRGAQDAMRFYLNNTNILITPDVAPNAATGVIRIVVWYIMLEPPTS